MRKLFVLLAISIGAAVSSIMPPSVHTNTPSQPSVTSVAQKKIDDKLNESDLINNKIDMVKSSGNILGTGDTVYAGWVYDNANRNYVILNIYKKGKENTNTVIWKSNKYRLSEIAYFDIKAMFEPNKENIIIKNVSDGNNARLDIYNWNGKVFEKLKAKGNKELVHNGVLYYDDIDNDKKYEIIFGSVDSNYDDILNCTILKWNGKEYEELSAQYYFDGSEYHKN